MLWIGGFYSFGTNGSQISITDDFPDVGAISELSDVVPLFGSQKIIGVPLPLPDVFNVTDNRIVSPILKCVFAIDSVLVPSFHTSTVAEPAAKENVASVVVVPSEITRSTTDGVKLYWGDPPGPYVP